MTLSHTQARVKAEYILDHSRDFSGDVVDLARFVRSIPDPAKLPDEIAAIQTWSRGAYNTHHHDDYDNFVLARGYVETLLSAYETLAGQYQTLRECDEASTEKWIELCEIVGTEDAELAIDKLKRQTTQPKPARMPSRELVKKLTDSIECYADEYRKDGGAVWRNGQTMHCAICNHSWHRDALANEPTHADDCPVVLAKQLTALFKSPDTGSQTAHKKSAGNCEHNRAADRAATSGRRHA